jgi:hypothetical protein
MSKEMYEILAALDKAAELMFAYELNGYAEQVGMMMGELEAAGATTAQRDRARVALTDPTTTEGGLLALRERRRQRRLWQWLLDHLEVEVELERVRLQRRWWLRRGTHARAAAKLAR